MPDTAEKIQISSLSLLKMLKHGESTRSFSRSLSLCFTPLPLTHTLSLVMLRTSGCSYGGDGLDVGTVCG